MSSNSSTCSSSPRLGLGNQQPHHQRPNPAFRPPNRSRRQNVDYGIGNLLAQLGTRELHGMDVYRWEDDDLSLRSAAAHARLPYDRMTKMELELFPDMSRAQASIALFLYIRNRTLGLWQLDPLVELIVDYILTELPKPFDSDVELVTGIHAYLQRHGFINFGIFHKLTTRCLDREKKIIVIGAGPSGLAAARQLKFFGFTVILLEGRARPGGRVQTIKIPNLPAADLGAMIVMGIVGNPLVTLIQQTPVNVFPVNSRCPIYDNQGKLVDSRKDDLIERSFNRILATISHLSHAMGVTETAGRKISLGKAFELILSQQELRVKNKWYKYWQKYFSLVKKKKAEKEKVELLHKQIADCMRRLRVNGVNMATATPESIAFDFTASAEQIRQRLIVRSLRKFLEILLKQYDDAERELSNIEQILTDFKRMEPSVVYMNRVDKPILDFHLANLEYGIGAQLERVSMKDWDQDDPYGFAGSHMTVKEGLGLLIGRLRTEDLTVHFEHVVDQIKYDEMGVTVDCSVLTDQQQNTKTSFKADAVLCTVPLGVLKRGDVKFEPELPRWKREAISNMGFGTLNKIILFFDKPFWDTKRSSFGRLNDTSASRGELFMFFSNGDQPVLFGLFAGAAAFIPGKSDEKIIRQNAMSALHKIFGNSCPLEPVDFRVSRWDRDKFALGSYSFMGLNSSPDDYDTLARSVYPNDGTSSTVPRVFFAGEHTNRQYPASVHGAFLSGLREAAKIADTFIGPLSSSGEVTQRTIAMKELSLGDLDPAATAAGTSGCCQSSGTAANGLDVKRRRKMDRNEAMGEDSSDDDVQFI
ncbi:Lysine-specific histone demethylase 1A [Globodera pallida]|nr:Lysine-specific histone demethylase 1A [Globodera pallida]